MRQYNSYADASGKPLSIVPDNPNTWAARIDKLSDILIARNTMIVIIPVGAETPPLPWGGVGILEGELRLKIKEELTRSSTTIVSFSLMHYVVRSLRRFFTRLITRVHITAAIPVTNPSINRPPMVFSSIIGSYQRFP